jgi:hypothetical protein
MVPESKDHVCHAVDSGGDDCLHHIARYRDDVLANEYSRPHCRTDEDPYRDTDADRYRDADSHTYPHADRYRDPHAPAGKRLAGAYELSGADL